MSANMKGLGARWGCNGITFTAGIVSTDNGQQVQSLNINRTSDSQEGRNGIGECVGKVFYNGKKEVTITVLPSHPTTIAGGTASLDAHMIPPGTTVTILDAEGASIDNLFGGRFNLISARQNLSNTNYAMVDLDLEQYTDNDVTTAVT